MSNYFSIGVESRIGLGFEKKRAGNACRNKCIYAWEGIKKMCCTRTRKINSVIKYVAKIRDGEEEVMFQI